MSHFNNTPWSEREDSTLRKLYGSLSIELLAERLQRGPKGVEKRISRLKLSTRSYHKWTADDDAFIRAHYKGDMVAKAIGVHLGVRKNMIIGRARRLGLQGPR
jgi:hypothetical protein